MNKRGPVKSAKALDKIEKQNQVLDSSSIITFKKPFKCKSKTQKDLLTSVHKNDVTICSGPAGGGKSITAIQAALELIKNDSRYQEILLLKSMTQLKDEVLPALPGDAMMKMYYQNMSFIDCFEKLIGGRTTEQLITANTIKFGVIGSLRGRSLGGSSGCVVILDEAQNVSHDNLKTILTRVGENCKLIILGDPDQIDIKNKNESSLARVIEKVRANPTDGVGIVEFTEEDIVRHRLTSYFINLFK